MFDYDITLNFTKLTLKFGTWYYSQVVNFSVTDDSIDIDMV